MTEQILKKELPTSLERARMAARLIVDDKGEDVKPVKDALNITLSEDGKRVVKIGSMENDEEHRWVCYYYDEEEEDEIISDLTDEMISERKTISFDYREIQSEDTGEETTAEPAE